MSEEREERRGGGGALWDRIVKGAGSGRQRRIRTLNTYQKRKGGGENKKQIHLATFLQLRQHIVRLAKRLFSRTSLIHAQLHSSARGLQKDRCGL